MGSIFGSGTGFVVPTLALVLSAMQGGAAAADMPHSVELEIQGLRNAKGFILVCLTANPNGFPDCSKDSGAVRLRVPASQATSGIQLNAPKSGNYAISVIHDENGNGKLDTALMIPKEGFGFSRNPAISFGPPKFASAAFSVNGDVRQMVRMKYML